MSTRRRLAPAAVVSAALAAFGSAPTSVDSLHAQVAVPNATGVAMGHVHYTVRDVAASRAFWVALGGRRLDRDPVEGAAELIEFPDVLVRLDAGTASGGSDDAVLNHVAFRVPSFASVEAAGLRVARLAQFPGVGSVTSPDGERVELFEDVATNLAFVPTVGEASGLATRHLKPVGRPIAFHHIHLYLPDQAAVDAAQGWYATQFGGVPGKRSQYQAVDLPGVNFNFSVGPRPVKPTKGRVLDHIGFEVRGVERLVASLRQAGVAVQQSPARGDVPARAFFVDPWGTAMEASERLGR